MVLNTVLTSHLGFQKRGQSKNTVVLDQEVPKFLAHSLAHSDFVALTH